MITPFELLVLLDDVQDGGSQPWVNFRETDRSGQEKSVSRLCSRGGPSG